jgi:hypothetical protein
MFTTGEGFVRQRMRRNHPDWTDGEIDEQVGAWLHERPGAENGDGEGRPVEWTSRVR